MNIQTTLTNYKSLGEFFAPDYEQENKVLSDFKKNNPILLKDQVDFLIDILKNSPDIKEKYFVADLLYLFDNFDDQLLNPMLKTAINFKDPSFNRIFLRPCIKVFGTRRISETLVDFFRRGVIEERIGISNLLYWLHPQENGEAENLHQEIIKQANLTDNIIELYHYKLRYSDKIKNSEMIPDNAEDLVKVVEGNAEYEFLLFNKLNWTKNVS